jgi:hypothetical protein
MADEKKDAMIKMDRDLHYDLKAAAHTNRSTLREFTDTVIRAGLAALEGK